MSFPRHLTCLQHVSSWGPALELQGFGYWVV
jgi:hypothetical protein